MLSKGIIEVVANNSETLLPEAFFGVVDSWYGKNVLRNLLKRAGCKCYELSRLTREVNNKAMKISEFKFCFLRGTKVLPGESTRNGFYSSWTVSVEVTR